jgi:hypothetical protein
VKLKGIIGEKISETVTISSGTEEAFNILKISPFKGTDIRCSLAEIELAGKKAFQITVENIKETEGHYMDKITIVTDKSDFPPLIITVSGEIKPLPIAGKNVEDNQSSQINIPEQKQ